MITIPDFTVVTCDHKNSKSTIVATFSNVKLTLTEAETIEVADLSGKWNAKPMGTYGSNSESQIPAEYSFVLAKTSEDNKNYDVALTIGDYPVINLTATFDGVQLSIHAKDVVVDATTGAMIYYNGSTDYSFTFTYASETTLSMSTPLCIALPNPDAAEDEPKYTMEQWYMDGSAKKEIEGTPTEQTWDGVWTVKADVMGIDGNTAATEFEMEVVYNEAADMYLITKFMGNDVTSLNYGGIILTTDGDKAEIKTGTYLKTIEAGVSYYVLYDMNVTTSPITVTMNADGTLSIANFCVCTNSYGGAAADAKLEGYYSNVSASKLEKPEPVLPEWAGVWTVKGTVQNFEGYENPATFEMEISYVEAADMYLITKFWGNDVTSLNYGGIMFSPEGTTAEIKAGTYLKTIEAGVSYAMLYDMNKTADPIKVTMNEDGTLTIANFCVCTNAYGGAATDAKLVGFYTDVTASQGSVEPEPVLPEWAGVWTVKGTVQNFEGYENPATFEMEISYVEAADMYLITKFWGNDVTSLNYGGILFSPEGTTAEIKAGTYLKTIEPGVAYAMLYDMNKTADPIKVSMNEDGTLTIANFCVCTNAYGGAAADAKLVGFYTDVTAVKGEPEEDAIEGIVAEDVIKVEYFNLSGIVLDTPVKGINIVKKTLKNGNVVTTKTFVR